MEKTWGDWCRTQHNCPFLSQCSCFRTKLSRKGWCSLCDRFSWLCGKPRMYFRWRILCHLINWYCSYVWPARGFPNSVPTNFSWETVQWTYSIFCIFPNLDFTLYLNCSSSSTVYFPLPPPLLLIKIQLWVKSLAGKSLYSPGSALYKKVRKTGCVLFDWSELNGHGSFSFKTHFFSHGFQMYFVS